MSKMLRVGVPIEKNIIESERSPSVSEAVEKMDKKQRIKIIKRGSEAPKQAAAEPQLSLPSNKQDAVTTVTEWVAEWRQKKETQNLRAFHKLFRQAA